jgi:hypothetical protein
MDSLRTSTHDPAILDPSLDCRAVTFENRTGARGAGGTVENGRKGAPSRTIASGERVQLADFAGPRRINHVWMEALLGARDDRQLFRPRSP